MLFSIKSSFKFPAWWLVTNDVTSGISQSSMFYFACFRLALCPHCFASFNLFVFCRGKFLTITETRATWTRRISWFLTWRHDPFRNPDTFLHFSAVIFIGRGWSENYKATIKDKSVETFEQNKRFLSPSFRNTLRWHCHVITTLKGGGDPLHILLAASPLAGRNIGSAAKTLFRVRLQYCQLRRLDLRTLKCQNPIFFLRIPFYTL